MLPKTNRLNKDDFDIVKKKGRMFASDSFGLIVLSSDSGFKSGIIVSKKVFKKAVNRNKAKRAIYRVLRELFDKIKTDFSVVFLVKSSIEGKSDNELKQEILKAFKKSGVIK